MTAIVRPLTASPFKVLRAGPDRNARRPSNRTSSGPPGKRTATARRPKAAATATALVPDDAVSPAPRSHTRASISRRRAAAPTWTFVRLGKRACVSSSGPIRGRSSGSPSTTACGLPTSTAVRRMPSTSSGSADPRPRPGPARRARPPQHRAYLTWTDADRDVVAPPPVPARGDARSVPRHLGLRSVRVPDRDLDPVVAAAEDLEHAVGCRRRAADPRSSAVIASVVTR